MGVAAFNAICNKLKDNLHRIHTGMPIKINKIVLWLSILLGNKYKTGTDEPGFQSGTVKEDLLLFVQRIIFQPFKPDITGTFYQFDKGIQFFHECMVGKHPVMAKQYHMARNKGSVLFK